MRLDPGSQPRFILLCDTSMQARYDDALRGASVPVVVAGSIGAVLRETLLHPPAGVIVDTSFHDTTGADDARLLADLGVAWPVLCASAQEGEPIRASTFGPPPFEAPLREAIEAIARGDTRWNHPRWKRRYARVPAHCRARFRCEPQTAGEAPGDPHAAWRLGTTLDLTMGGCFILTYDPGATNSIVQIELRDLGPTREPVSIRGRVAWCRRWDDSELFPGMGVEFEAGPDQQVILQYLSEPRHINGIIVAPL